MRLINALIGKASNATSLMPEGNHRCEKLRKVDVANSLTGVKKAWCARKMLCESTSFTSMGSLVRVQYRPHKKCHPSWVNVIQIRMTEKRTGTENVPVSFFVKKNAEKG